MNRIVFILDTGLPVIYETVKRFVDWQDSVLLAVTKFPAKRTTGVEYVLLDGADDIERIADDIARRYGRLDILILGTAERISDGAVGLGHDYERFTDVLTKNVMLCRSMIEVFQPLLEKGMKRIACITEKESSNSWSEGSADLAYSASLAAVNMLGRMMFNRLRPSGFTFRWFCDADMPGGMSAAEYITSALCFDPKEPYTHSDENRFVLRDAYLREISW